MIIKINKIIIPDIVIYNQNQYVITDLNSKYHISKYIVILNNNHQLKRVHITKKHPNVDSIYGLCFPICLKEQKWDSNLKYIIENILKIFNLDNCYFTPKYCDLKYS
jgi:hypothetical protein